MTRPANGNRWLYAWGGLNVALGCVSLLAPLYVIAAGGNAFALGALWALSSLSMAPAAVIVGRLADRYRNHRPIALACFVATAVLLVAYPAVDSVRAILLIDATLWFAVAAAEPVLSVLIISNVDADRWNRVIGSLFTYEGYGWTAGLVLGTIWAAGAGQVLNPIDVQRSLFVACAAIAGGSTVIASRWLPRTGEPPSPATLQRRMRVLAGRARRRTRPAGARPISSRLLFLRRASIDPRVLVRRFPAPLVGYLGVAALFFTGFAVFGAPLPAFLAAVDVSTGSIFALFVVASLGSAALYGTAGSASSRYDPRLLQSVALATRGVVYPATAVVGATLAPSVAGLAALAVLFAVGGGAWAFIAVITRSVVTRLAPEPVRGEALGVYTAVTALTGAIGALVGGWIAATYGYLAAFGIASVLVVAGTVAIAFLGDFPHVLSEPGDGG